MRHLVKPILILAAICLVGCAGGQPQSITSQFFTQCEPRLDFRDPAWSPDGKTLLLTVTDDTGIRVGAINTDGTGQLRMLTRAGSNNFDAVWSPDGTQIAFTSTRDDPDPTSCTGICLYQIYVMASDGSGQTRLITGPDSYYSPQWSPDGRQILVRIGTKSSFTRLGLVQADGSGLRKLPEDLGGSSVWLPDGLHIAYWTFVDDQLGLFVANPDGPDSTRLNATPVGVNYTQPVWLPDGEHIAYPDARYTDIEWSIASLDGSAPQRLTNNPSDELYPAWSPDGEYVAFQADRGSGKTQIVLIKRSNETGYSEIVTGGVSNAIQLTHVSGGSFSPVWSPDSKRIAYIGVSGDQEVYVMDINSGTQIQLTHNPANQQCLTWPF